MFADAESLLCFSPVPVCCSPARIDATVLGPPVYLWRRGSGAVETTTVCEPVVLGACAYLRRRGSVADAAELVPQTFMECD